MGKLKKKAKSKKILKFLLLCSKTVTLRMRQRRIRMRSDETTDLKNYSVMRFSSVVTVVEVRGHTEAAEAADQVHL